MSARDGLRVVLLPYSPPPHPDARLKIVSDHDVAPLNAGDAYGWDEGVALEVRCTQSLTFYEETE